MSKNDLRPTVRNLEKDCVRMELMRRGWTTRGLADKCGYAAPGFFVEFSRGFPSKRARYATEAAFGYELAIWSTPGELALRSACKAKYAIDPFLEKKAALLPFANKLGVESVSCFHSRAPLVAAIMSRLVADPDLLSPSNSKHPNSL